MGSSLFVFLVFFFLFLMSVVFHELGHAAVALWCGDPTARDQGRITLNPIAHLDPMWSLVMPVVTTLFIGLPFGGARPVPVNPLNFRRPVRDDVLVTLAGPAANLVQALIYALVFQVVFRGWSAPQVVENSLGVVLVGMVYVNLFLGLFNLVPVPPLDGSHVLAALLPAPLARIYRGVGMLGIVLLLALFYATNLGQYLWLGTVEIMALLGLDVEVTRLSMYEIFNLASKLFGG